MMLKTKFDAHYATAAALISSLVSSVGAATAGTAAASTAAGAAGAGLASAAGAGAAGAATAAAPALLSGGATLAGALPEIGAAAASAAPTAVAAGAPSLAAGMPSLAAGMGDVGAGLPSMISGMGAAPTSALTDSPGGFGAMLSGANSLISSPGQTVGGKVGGMFGNEKLGGQIGQTFDAVTAANKSNPQQQPVPMPPAASAMLQQAPAINLPGVGGQQGFHYDNSTGRLVYG